MIIKIEHIIAFVIGLVLGFLLLQISIFNYSKKDSQEKDLQDKSGFIRKKDLYYWIGFLLFIIIASISSKIYLLPQLSDYIGFAGTLTSIVLGVVAIIYSLIQGSESAKGQYEIEKSCEELKKISEELNTSFENLKNLSNSVKENIDIMNNLNEKIIGIEDNIGTKISEVVGNINQLAEKQEAFHQNIIEDAQNTLKLMQTLKKDVKEQQRATKELEKRITINSRSDNWDKNINLTNYLPRLQENKYNKFVWPWDTPETKTNIKIKTDEEE